MKPTLLILAAGMGSRYGGIKQIDSVGAYGQTLLDYGIFDAKEAGFEKVVFVVRKSIEKEFRYHLFDRIARNMDATYVFQHQDSLLNEEQLELSAGRVKPWGTIHAVLCAREEIHGSFAVINADDYYGKTPYVTLYNHLAGLAPDAKEHAMVGYVLENTTSRIGTVSRAICSEKGGYLKSMVEHTKIGYEGDSLMSFRESGSLPLTGKEWVSMNFFGFAHSAFDSFERYWHTFIEEHVTSEKNECYLPNGVGNLVAKGEGKVRFYTTDEHWFGMTYAEDRENVKLQLAKKTEEGLYPEQLWLN